MAITTCSIGVMAHNEEKNIGHLLQILLSQKTNAISVKEIIIVESGCTDNTEEVVKKFENLDNQVRLLVQEKRQGKASAINYFLQNASANIYVIESGDTLPREDTIENLLEPFSDPKIGMTGGRPMPQDNPYTFLGFTTHLLWQLHHMLALKYPKLGEIVAFKDAINIPVDTAVDEATIEALITQKGYKLHYAPKAIVYNRGSNTIKQFLMQRRRIYAGHIHLKKTLGYEVASMNALRILKLLLRHIKMNPQHFLWITGAVLLESLGRSLGLFDFYKNKKELYIWHR